MSVPNPLLDALPGLRMPVDEVTRMLRHMWDGDPKEGAHPVSSFRASQMNLILHFGLETSAAEARARFDSAIAFAQRYPCRIIVLCPEGAATRKDERLEGKLFSQCYVGKSLHDFCCCEALVLGYSVDDARFLESQVSLWLEADLPVYHWLNRVPPERVGDCYLPFLTRCRRVLFDSDTDPALATDVDWPERGRVHDLAWARLLPVRQHLGQFLGAVPPDRLVGGLERVSVRYADGHAGEGHNLLAWMRGALERCAPAGKSGAPASIIYSAEPAGEDSRFTLEVEWSFLSQKKHFSWEYHARAGTGRVTCNFGHGVTDQPLHVEPLPEAGVLAEGLFFG